MYLIGKTLSSTGTRARKKTKPTLHLDDLDDFLKLSAFRSLPALFDSRNSDPYVRNYWVDKRVVDLDIWICFG